MADYKYPEVLVSTEWAAEHLNDPTTRLVEVDVDNTAYEQGHIPGAIGWNWQTQLQDTIRRDLVPKSALEELLARSGIWNETTILLYGDHNNWFAAYAFWQLKFYGHRDVRLIDGCRKKWMAESRPLTTVAPRLSRVSYHTSGPNASLRACRDEVFTALDSGNHAKPVDVRSADEFTGRIVAPAGLSEGAQRAGHIPGAVNVPWSETANEDGTFKAAEDLKRLYESRGIDGHGDIITYCRIGERSAHSWFALKYLLGYDNVRNYDGSWTEWGSLVGAPIERDTATTDCGNP